MVLELCLTSWCDPDGFKLRARSRKERNFMAQFLLRGPILTNLTGSISKNLTGFILKKILIVAACVLTFARVETPALAQHPGGHAGGGGHVGGGARMSTPVRVPMAPPRVGGGLRGVGPRGVGLGAAGVGAGGFRFRPGGFHVFRRRLFFGAPLFRFGYGLGFNSLWWPTCGPYGGWAWGGGFDCYPVQSYGFGFENYVTMPPYENRVYEYGGDERDLIWLYFKDGTVYGVSDYWFVNGQVHFSMAEDDPTKPAEHVIPYDQLDVQKTIYVNTRRGFRIVFRDEPWQQYLKDYPDLTPPDVPPAQNN
jgi:hypothetical protein